MSASEARGSRASGASGASGTSGTQAQRTPVGAVVLMGLTILWAGGLAAGFVYVAAGSDLTTARRSVYALLALLTLVLAVSTTRELVRRLRGRH